MALLAIFTLSANPAFATSGHAAAAAAQPAPLTVRVAAPRPQSVTRTGIEHQSEVAALPTAECAAFKTALQKAHGGSTAKCEVGIGLVTRSVSGARVSGHAVPASGTWYTYEEQATACFGDQATWNGPNSSYSCAEGYVGMSDEFAWNGDWINLHWENPYYASTKGYGFTRTWYGVTGNNTPDMTVGDNFNYTYLLGTGTMELRIHNSTCPGYVCESAQAWWQHT
jgi:hypothetical protein